MAMAAARLLILLATGLVAAAVPLDQYLPLIEVDGYSAHYHTDEAARTVNVHILVRGTGYVGWGMTTTGTMEGADIFIGGCTEAAGSTYFNDYHGVGNQVPVVDTVNDITIGFCSDNGTHTEIDFTRKFNTGDTAHDHVIPKGPIQLIWAIGVIDSLQHHGNRRGVETVIIRREDPPTDDCSDGTTKFIPNPFCCESFYMCHAGIPTKLECTNGQQFNPISLQCNDADIVECGIHYGKASSP